MKNTITILLLTFLALPVFGQFKMTPPEDMDPPAVTDKSAIQINTEGINTTSTPNLVPSTPYATLPSIALKSSETLDILRDLKTDRPIWIKGIPENMDRDKTSTEEKAFAYLEAVQEVISIDQPANEFNITNTQTDAQGRLHIRMQQSFEGVKIYGSEIMLHTNSAAEIHLFNGRYFPTPTVDIRQQNFTQTAAEELVKSEITKETALLELSPEGLKMIDGEPLKSTLMIYYPENNLEDPRLIWHVEIIPNVTNRWEYFVDANTGEILFHHKNICQLFGWHEDHDHHSCTAKNPIISEEKIATSNEIVLNEETAIADDLSNVSRQISVWRDGSTYIMIDASRNMYNAAQSNLPESAVGVIGTFDANNTYPGQGANINIVNHGNNNSWTRNEVSAHYNAGIAYEYFRTVFGRNSIKDQGENIFSVINVSDENGNDMDNAFWNGETMFYGNGNQAFSAPLAKALDVAGHEMAHGVVQSTANLVYQGEAGALNESYADIFGAMIDREDWQIGEEVANPSVFPTGTMRDMANPNNGGNSSNFFWQPAHYNERFTGSADNGGVHINSGIPNHAYYLFATSNGIGKAKAEQIFYKALTDYLVMSSQFVDLRVAVVQAATDIHGNGSAEVAAASAAFDAVGIPGGSGGDYQIDTDANPGDDFILWSDDNLSNINTSAPTSPEPTLLGAFTEDNHISRPSISDDGTAMTYVHADGSLRLIELDWSSGSPQITGNFNLNNTSTWRNIVVSKDGTKVAALFGDLSQNEFDNEVLVFDFISEEGVWFTLSNPTTANGLSTGDVLFADALEFDITGEFLLYDAFNQIPSSFGEDIEYWDIGVLKVWDNGTNSFANSVDPQISKIFNNLGEQVSVGNPTFAKNSPYIIAFDFVESTLSGTNYSVYGVNIQTGNQGVIFENNKPGYPSYSVDDDFVMFSITNQGSEILAFTEVDENKTTGSDGFILIENATWGAWYAIGERDLVATDDLVRLSNEFSVLPNPSAGRLNLRYSGTKQTQASVKIYDALGQMIEQSNLSLTPESTTALFDLSNSPSGSYILQITTDEGQVAKRVVKQ